MTHEFKTPLASILIASQYATHQEEIKNQSETGKIHANYYQQSQN
jgi:two-component system, OmpR family, phosphate regulon sensor histidine kinase PhoR